LREKFLHQFVELPLLFRLLFSHQFLKGIGLRLGFERACDLTSAFGNGTENSRPETAPFLLVLLVKGGLLLQKSGPPLLELLQPTLSQAFASAR
jgi:hypothetical protein